MNGELSPNAQAILLLTAPLLVGRSPTSVRPLPLGAYNKLALALADEWGAEAWPDPGTPDALRQFVSSGEGRSRLAEEPDDCELGPTIGPRLPSPPPPS